MLPLCAVAVNPARLWFRPHVRRVVGMARKSPAPPDIVMVEGTGLWDVAGPHSKNTAACRAINGARLLRKSRPEAPS